MQYKFFPSRSLTFWRCALVVLAALGLSACADFSGIAPRARVTEPQDLGLGAGSASSSTVTPALAPWWTRFGDAQLNALVTQALQNSPTVKLARSRIDRALALTAMSRSAELPSVSASVDATRQRFSANGIYPPPLAGNVYNTANAQMTASYEADLFGKNRAQLDAAMGQARAAHADAQVAQLLLATQVTRGYVALQRLYALQQLAQAHLVQREQLLALSRQRLQAGLDSTQELMANEASLSDIRQYAESLREQTAIARNALAALTGQPLGWTDLQPVPLGTLKAVAIPAAVALDLLANRPDIAAARARVEASLGEVEAAKAMFYPNINVVAFAGLNSIGFDRITHAGSEQWGVGPALRLPIFDAGRLRGQLKGKTAEVDIAIETYNALLIDAVREVADQIAALQSLRVQRMEQQAAQTSAQTAYDIANERFDAGLSSRISVLAAQSPVLAQQRQAIELHTRALDAQALLMRATAGSLALGALAP
jgi:NodT family efflux transporter outer membrane factor (OMF) lipoprotein